jgi:hypothetical protein
MNIKWTSLSAMLLICGCTNGQKSSVDPHIQLNGSPSQSYIVDIDFKNHPGPFSDVEATAHYRVGDGCTPPRPFSGAVLPPEHAVELVVKRIDDDSYRATFHLDALRDEDYFGLGVCRWAFQNVAVRFRSPATQFIASYSGSKDGIPSNAKEVLHYLVADYFKMPEVGGLVFGERADFYLPKLGPQFQVVLSAKKSPPDTRK